MFETRKEEASVEEIRELKERLERERPVEWEAFPDIGLYMDQLISYMPRQLIHYGEGESLTSAMVNNYIKDGAMPRAEGKRYSRTHLAYLTALCALKQVLSVKDAGLLLAAASEGRPPPEAVRTVSGGAGPGAGRDGGQPGRQRRGGGAARPGPGPRSAQLCRPAGLSADSGTAAGAAAPAGEEPKITGRARYV